MNFNKMVECERNNLEKLKKYQLPNYCKSLGFTITALAFVGIIINKFILDSDLVKEIGKYGLTFGLLIVSISKEKIEDELITKIRMTSYSFAFIFAVLWSFLIPLIVFAVDSVVDSEPAVLKENGDFLILWSLLAMQVVFFHLFKRMA